jgi:hypothetical protein
MKETPAFVGVGVFHYVICIITDFIYIHVSGYYKMLAFVRDFELNFA